MSVLDFQSVKKITSFYFKESGQEIVSFYIVIADYVTHISEND